MSYKTNPKLNARREAIRAHWFRNPTATAADVGALFGVSGNTASSLKPTSVRRDAARLPKNTGQRDTADLRALKLYAEDLPLSEIAEATGRSIATTRRVLRAAYLEEASACAI